METNDFRTLLIDLYNTYNPDRLEDVERISTQYNGREFDAIKTVYIKYNFKQSPFYDPNLGTDKHVKYLIESYSDKERVLSDEFISNEKLNKEKKQVEERNKINEETQKQESEKNSQLSELQQKIEEQEKNVEEKLKETNEQLKKELEELKKIMVEDKKVDVVFEQKCPFDIHLKFNFEEEVVLPDLNNFLYVSINQRIILAKKEGGIIGVEVKDILDNYIDCEKPIREIILDKV